MALETNAGETESRTNIAPDTAKAKVSLAERIHTAVRNPVNLTIAGILFTLGISAEYFFSRAMDALWEAEPPEEIVRLNSELQSSSGELQQTTRQLQNLVSRIDTSAVEDPRLRAQLDQLNGLLPGLNDLVSRTSANTDRVATYAQTLHEDWIRMQSQSDGSIDSVPDLVLGNGEGVELCNGLTSFGIRQIQRDRVVYVTATELNNVATGGRVALDDGSYLDYLGAKDGRAMFKVNCD